ncbi:MAG: hypothetical protein A4E19_04530 [Nitrospira sp. SG-bin1]|nr:MAG: hypothetical protein A4E19_04530 [Nitrospira sp. SG-bin1]
MKLTQSAVERLKALVQEHPEDPIVRVQVKDLDEARLAFSITLEANVQPDDDVRIHDGLTVAIPATSTVRMNGVTVDYQEGSGFTFHHADHQDDLRLGLINLN